MNVVELLRRRVDRVSLPQVARLIELVARRSTATARAEVGGDLPPSEEPLHFIASDRMTLVSSDIAAIDPPGETRDAPASRQRPGAIVVTANVMGLAGATPALPAFYSEVQLQRRRLRDPSLAGFLNIFDHRALSFFYRIFRKYNRVVAFERETIPGSDVASRTLLALGGFATPAARDRLSFDDVGLASLAHHLGNVRRTVTGLTQVLRQLTGCDLRIVEATPTWLALPAGEQTRLGHPVTARFSRLGGSDAVTGLGFADAALIGSAVLDVQHHYTIEIGPLSHAELLRFCSPEGPTAMIGEACLLFTGVAYRPGLRLAVQGSDVPPLQLASPERPAWLGRTTWLGDAGPALRTDCVIPITPATASGPLKPTAEYL